MEKLMFLKVAGSVVLFACLCGVASAQGYQEYIQYPQYPQRSWQPNVNQVEVNNFNQQVQAPPQYGVQYDGQATRRMRPDFYHYHEHQWVPQQRNRYDNYCQPQNFSYSPYYYGQQPSFYVPQQTPWRCW